MRFFSIITAILVMAALYLLVFERERIIEFANGSGSTDSVATASEADATSPEDPTGHLTGKRIVSVIAIRSQSDEIASAVLVRGRTEAARQVRVQSETSGKVISKPLPKGSEIAAGQTLCQLDPGTREISLLEAKARLAQAKAGVPAAQARLPEAVARQSEAEARLVEAEINLRAAMQLSQDGYASETRVAAAQAAYESAAAAVQSAKSGVASAKSGVETAAASVQSAQAAVAAAEREIDRLVITAPFAGILESDSAETGSLLQPGALCATIIQLDPIKLVGYIPETEVSLVYVGVQAGARLATGQEVAGKVTFLSRSADPITRTFRVEVQVPNTDKSIRDGQTAEIVISSAGEAAHLLPLSAVTLNDNGDLGVRTVTQENIVKFIPVSVVRDTIDGMWVTGLPDIVDVIVVGQEYVTDGVPVKVTYREPAK